MPKAVRDPHTGKIESVQMDEVVSAEDEMAVQKLDSMPGDVEDPLADLAGEDAVAEADAELDEPEDEAEADEAEEPEDAELSEDESELD